MVVLTSKTEMTGSQQGEDLGERPDGTANATVLRQQAAWGTGSGGAESEPVGRGLGGEVMSLHLVLSVRTPWAGM